MLNDVQLKKQLSENDEKGRNSQESSKSRELCVRGKTISHGGLDGLFS